MVVELGGLWSTFIVCLGPRWHCYNIGRTLVVASSYAVMLYSSMPGHERDVKDQMNTHNHRQHVYRLLITLEMGNL
jgi:hypothetical protein